jgi:transcriptional regulator with XRE-family HTH domain
VKEARNRRGWKQHELAARLKELGHTIEQPTVARIETGKRAVSIDELFELATALGVAPVHLLVPLEDEAQVKIAPKRTLPAPEARAWIRGQLPLDDAELAAYLAELPRSEQQALVRAYLARRPRAPGVGPLARALGPSQQLVDELADELSNPKEDDDG